MLCASRYHALGVDKIMEVSRSGGKIETDVKFPIKGLNLTKYVLNSDLPAEYLSENM